MGEQRRRRKAAVMAQAMRGARERGSERVLCSVTERVSKRLRVSQRRLPTEAEQTEAEQRRQSKRRLSKRRLSKRRLSKRRLSKRRLSKLRVSELSVSELSVSELRG